MMARTARRRRRARQDARERRLEKGGLGLIERTRVARLYEIVDALIPAGQPDPMRLESLLDVYVDLAIEQRRCQILLASARPREERLAVSAVCHPTAAGVMTRRLDHARLVFERIGRLEDALGEIDELIRLHAARTSMPEGVDAVLAQDLAGEVLERLAALDAVDTSSVGLGEAAGEPGGQGAGVEDERTADGEHRDERQR